MVHSHHGKGMKKLEGAKASKCEDEGVDFISNMPDAILVSILSRLPYKETEEVVRSSILSRRWRYLWTSIPSISISCYRGSNNSRNFKKKIFKEFVNWVLLKQSVDLDRFHLSCSSYYSMSTVGRWIHAAVTRNVKQLDLTFRPKEKEETETEDVEMPHCLVTCPSLEVLKLNLNKGHSLRLPNIKGFPALRVLHLSSVDFLEKDDLIESFLGSSPLLEDLSLIECVMYEVDRLCISCPNLKRLKIKNENSLILGGIKIFCPKLVDLHLGGHFADSIFFESLDSLKEAVILPDWLGSIIPVVLFPGFSHVESLSIDLHFFTQCIDAARDPGLPNLKTLVLTTTMDVFTMDNFNRVLKNYLKLESLKLTIKQDFDEEYEWLDDDETMRILTPDVGSLEYFELNGEEPELNIDWFESILTMSFVWGGKKNLFYG